MSELAGINLTPEEWGGDTVCCKISAKSGKGIDELLDNVLTVAELLELKANPNRLAEGSVIDAQMDKEKVPRQLCLFVTELCTSVIS